MAIRLVVGALLSGVVLMAWGFVFWMFAPWPKELLRDLPQQDVVVDVLEKADLQTGVYLYPKHGAAGGAAQDDFTRRRGQGPLLQLFYHRGGAEPMTTRTYLEGYGQVALAALLAGIVLASAGLRSYVARVGLTLFMGLFAVVLVQLGAPIWFNHPWDYHLMFAGYHLVNALLIGLVMGALVKPAVAQLERKPVAER